MREFVVSVVSVVPFTQISRDFRGKRDVRESSWCLWCPLLKSREISGGNEMCERVRGVRGVLYSYRHHELSRTSRFPLKSREI